MPSRSRSPRRTVAAQVAEGNTVPEVSLQRGFPPKQHALKELCAGRKVPGYLKMASELKAKGIAEVIIFCVNDGAVMKAWEADQKVPADGLVKFYCDPSCEVTQALGLALTHAGPMSVLCGGSTALPRCKRFAAIIDNGIVKKVQISHTEEDPAGDDDPSLSCADTMLNFL